MISTPRLVLVEADDELLEELSPLSGEVLPEGSEPFELGASFYDSTPAGRTDWLTRQRAARRRTAADWWVVTLACVLDGRPVGVQEITGIEFPAHRSVETFSWLARSTQGQGIGTEMRRAALHLVFDGLGARTALSEAFDDNPASWRVSERLGYRFVETFEADRPSGPAPMRRMALDAHDWVGDRDVELSGVDDFRRRVGLV